MQKATLYVQGKDGVLRRVEEAVDLQCPHVVEEVRKKPIPGLQDFTVTVTLPTHNLIMPPPNSDPESN